MLTHRSLSKIANVICCLLILFSCAKHEPLRLDQWTYIQVDHNRAKWGDWDKPEWLRYFGLDIADVDSDTDLDIVAGRYWYRNPGGNMSETWERIDFGMNVDGMLAVNIDDDEFSDVIAEALPNVYWLEAADMQASSWDATKIGELPKTGHVNGQGYTLAQIIAGEKPEILLAAEGGIYYCLIPKNPTSDKWNFTLIAETHSDEGIGIGDIDNDGDVDVVAGKIPEGGEEPTQLNWWENQGSISAPWPAHLIGSTDHAIDRVEVADMNNDSRLDIIISEERWPGLEPDASLYWFTAPSNPKSDNWERHIIVTQYSMNNLDVADLDKDGEMDIVTNEHKGQLFKLQIWRNDNATFIENLIDTGKECHLGCQLADMDQDGDLDIVSTAWDNYKFLHLWRNDAINH